MTVPARPTFRILAVVLLATPTAARGQDAWAAALDDFAAQLAADVETDAVGGLVAGVVVDGDLVWARAFGLADRDRGIPMGTASVSRTGSISKSITAVLMMRLVEQGVIALDDPVEDYLPSIRLIRNAPPDAGAITFRHLASHTAGIAREPELDGAASGPISGWEDKVIASLAETRYDTVPGGRYRYSNIGFGALGLALSRAAGRSFMDLVEEEIFTPLGMTGSTYVLGDLEPRLAAGYVNRPDGSVDASAPAREHAGRGYKVPNGGVYSTVADLGRFMGALSGVPGLSILSEQSRREILRVQTPGNPSRGYGLGLSIEIDSGGRTIASHGGSVAGYTAFMAFDPDARIGVALMRNYQRGTTNLGSATQTVLRLLRDLDRP